MKPLPILWQRLVTPEGQTCDRCHGTRQAIEQAMPKLREALRPLGMEPVLETRQMNVETFKGSPSESNRIWIAGQSIESWLGASVGNSTCCSACAGEECRTLEIGGDTFETIPEELILKAALRAASECLGRGAAEGGGAESSKPRSCCTSG